MARSTVRTQVWLVVIVAAATTVVATRAPAQSSPHSQSLAALALRVLSLESEVKLLKDRVRALESRQLSASPKAGASAVPAAPPTAKPPGGSVAAFPSSSEATPSSCDPPYQLDERGIRRPKPGCGKPSAACQPPFEIGADGIRRVKPGCNAQPAAQTCDPPYTLDESGVRQPKPHCLH